MVRSLYSILSLSFSLIPFFAQSALAADKIRWVRFLRALLRASSILLPRSLSISAAVGFTAAEMLAVCRYHNKKTRAYHVAVQ